MPRRTHTYKAEMGWAEGNLWSTVGAMILGFGILAVVLQVIYTCLKGEKCKNDPWDARTLEWLTTSPPQPYNFAFTPVIKARDQVWENKHGAPEKKMDRILPDEHGIHMPDQSWWPLVVCLGLFIAGLGMVFLDQPLESLFPFISYQMDVSIFHLTVPGLLIVLGGIFGWALEGPGGYHLHPNKEELEDN
jgi:cytochrome c oxidase subunit 1